MTTRNKLTTIANMASTVESMPTKLHQELLVHGYTRNCETKTMNIPKCIKQLCLSAYNECIHVEISGQENLQAGQKITGSRICIKGIHFEGQFMKKQHSAGFIINVLELPKGINKNQVVWYYHAYCPQLDQFKHKRWNSIKQGQIYDGWYHLDQINGDLEIICNVGVSYAEYDDFPGKCETIMRSLTKIEWHMTKINYDNIKKKNVKIADKRYRSDLYVDDINLEEEKTEEPAVLKILVGPASQDANWFVSYAPGDREGLVILNLLKMPIKIKKIRAYVTIKVFYGEKATYHLARTCWFRADVQDSRRMKHQMTIKRNKPTRIIASIEITAIYDDHYKIDWGRCSQYGVTSDR